MPVPRNAFQGVSRPRTALPGTSLLHTALMRYTVCRVPRRRCWATAEPRGYDWLWSQHHEIRETDLLSVFEAVVSLSQSISTFCEESAAHASEYDEDTDGPVSVDPLPAWVPWLKIICSSIREHIHPPVALASGHRGLADKTAAEAFKFHLQTSRKVPLKRIADTELSQTGDMGVEMGIPDFRIKSHESLLPVWVQNLDTSLDVEAISEEQLPSQPDIEEGSGSLDGPMLAASDESHCFEPELDMDDVAPGVSRLDILDEEFDIAEDGLIFFMPNSLTIAGLQHIINNLCADTHKSLTHWGKFHADLKNLEAFLNVPERTDRFIWTCLRHTRFAVFEHKFIRFSQSMYEARWHEVVCFLKKVMGVLQTLILTFDVHKYLKGTDAFGNDQEKQPRKEKSQEERKGFVQFNPHALAKFLKDPFSVYYCNMAFTVEQIPSALAREAECCICHKPLVKGMSEYRRKKLFEKHYGAGEGFCLMAGKIMPELVAGGLEDALEEIWGLQENVLRHVSYAGLNPPSSADWTRIIADFNQARLNVLSQLRVKTDYVKRLPVKFCGLAVISEEGARKIGKEIIEDFEKDPQQSVHHRITWKLMQPGAVFQVQLRLFVSGVRRNDLACAYRMQVALFRFPSGVETTIEEKHSRVAIALKAHHIGPVRVSLSNRLPLLERLMRRNQVAAISLLEHFTKARQTSQVPALLGIDMHPGLMKSAGRSRRAANLLLPKVIKVVYRCAPPSIYRNIRNIIFVSFIVLNC